MQGVRDLAALVLDKQVRLGRPSGFQGLPEATGGPAFATCAGLLRYAALHQAERPAHHENRMADAMAGGTFGRLGGWLRKNF
jgi:cell division protein FtsA